MILKQRMCILAILLVFSSVCLFSSSSIRKDIYTAELTTDFSVKESTEELKKIVVRLNGSSILLLIDEVETRVETKSEDIEKREEMEKAKLFDKAVMQLSEKNPMMEVLPEENAQDFEWQGEILNQRNGTVEGPSGKETFYNLDMSGVIRIMQNLGYNYEYHIREDGVKMYGPYIMCAANLELRPRGTILETSLGTAIVCDTGGFAQDNPMQLDIAVNW